jgi:hypothetical protein
VLVAKNVTLTSKTLIALPTTEVLSMPVLVHGLCIFAAKNELENNKTSTKCPAHTSVHKEIQKQ